MSTKSPIFLFIITFLFIFGPVFRQVGAWLDSIFLTSLLLTFYGLLVLKLRIPSYLKYFYPLIILYSYAQFTITIYGFFEIGDYIRNLLIPIRILTTLYGGFTLVILIKRNFTHGYIELILRFIYLSVLIHAIIMTFQLIYPEFKDWIYNYTSTGDFREGNEYNFRMGGLTGSSGDSVLSVVQSLGIIIIPFLLKHVKAIWKGPIILGGAIIFYSILISGRSGIWSTLIFLPLNIFLLSDKKEAAFFLKNLINIGIVAIGFFLTIQFFDKIEIESPTYYALKRSLDTFLAFESSGKFKDNTISVLSSHILLPNDFRTLILGNAEHLIKTQFDRTLNSDIGYIRNLWSFGIIFSCVYWYPIFKVCSVAYGNLKRHPISVIVFSFTLIMLIFQAKENYYYVRMFLSILSLALFCLYVEEKTLDKKK